MSLPLGDWLPTAHTLKVETPPPQIQLGPTYLITYRSPRKMPHLTSLVRYRSHTVSLSNKKLFFSIYYVKIPDCTRLNGT